MTGRSIPLVQLARISKPCPLAVHPWGAGERRRRCTECDLDVHNLSALSVAEAEAVLRASGRVCASFVPDSRGIAITGDRRWALRWASLRGRLARFAAGLGVAALLGARTAGCATGGEVVSSRTGGVIDVDPGPPAEGDRPGANPGPRGAYDSPSASPPPA